jgi:hypothetical protein
MIFKGYTIKNTTMTSTTFLVVVSKFAKLEKKKMTNYVDHLGSWSLQNILKPQQQAWHSSLWFHKLQQKKKQNNEMEFIVLVHKVTTTKKKKTTMMSCNSLLWFLEVT